MIVPNVSNKKKGREQGEACSKGQVVTIRSIIPFVDIIRIIMVYIRGGHAMPCHWETAIREGEKGREGAAKGYTCFELYAPTLLIVLLVCYFRSREKGRRLRSEVLQCYTSRDLKIKIRSYKHKEGTTLNLAGYQSYSSHNWHGIWSPPHKYLLLWCHSYYNNVRFGICVQQSSKR